MFHLEAKYFKKHQTFNVPDWCSVLFFLIFHIIKEEFENMNMQRLVQ
jgi:hypothetical protein